MVNSLPEFLLGCIWWTVPLALAKACGSGNVVFYGQGASPYGVPDHSHGSIPTYSRQQF